MANHADTPSRSPLTDEPETLTVRNDFGRDESYRRGALGAWEVLVGSVFGWVPIDPRYRPFLDALVTSRAAAREAESAKKWAGRWKRAAKHIDRVRRRSLSILRRVRDERDEALAQLAAVREERDTALRKLRVAFVLIHHLEQHEGAEGWSDQLRQDLQRWNAEL